MQESTTFPLVAGQKHALQGMVGHTNFPPTIPFHLLFMLSKLGNLCIYNKINSWFSICRQFAKGLQAGWFCLAGCRLPTPGLR